MRGAEGVGKRSWLIALLSALAKEDATVVLDLTSSLGTAFLFSG